MTDDLIKTFLYQEVMRLAFEVTDQRLRDQWIRACVNSYREFWEVDDFPCKNPRSPLTLEVEGFDMYCEITIKALDDFSVTIYSFADRIEELILRHEAHSSNQQDFVIPYAFNPEQRSDAKTTYTTTQLEQVIDYILLHPFVHIHLKSPEIPKNNIRLGGGISNILQYLFHLRYQFCPERIRQPKATGTDRHPERHRLVALFDDAIRNGKATITPAELMKIPKCP